MSNKTLSTGTLSLRFMQNALRSQQLQQVELERAEVKDEGKWEVGQDVKDAWGIGQGTQLNTVIYESSYLPFLFSPDHEETTENRVAAKPLGRRVFDKNGHDVSGDQPPSQQAYEEGAIPDEDASTTPSSPSTLKAEEKSTRGRRLKVHARPISMTSLSVGKKLKGFDTFDKEEEKETQRQRSISGIQQRSAKQAIFDTSGVGVDLRSTRKSRRNKTSTSDSDDGVASSDEDGTKAKKRKAKNQQQKTAKPKPTFLKPAGVVEPLSHPTPSASIGNAKHPSSPIPDIIDGARKRTRDPGDQSNEKRKKKKKKQKVSAE